MSALLTPFETSLMNLLPMYLLRGTAAGFIELSATGLPISCRPPAAAGSQLIAGDGIFAAESFRFDGGSLAGGSNYLSVKAGSAIKPTTAMTLLFSMGALRNLTPSPSKAQVSLFGCYAQSGYVCALLSTGQVGLSLFAGGSRRMCYFNRSLLNETSNLLHFTFDGRYLNAFVNGIVVQSVDIGSVVTINQNLYDILMAATMDTNGGVTSINDFADVDVAYFAVYNFALSAAQIAEQFAVSSAFQHIGGTALLDDGSPASNLRISKWEARDVADIVPQSNGSWSAAVPPGDYLVTAIGPAGYRPISHGPVTAVDP